jgi:DNA-directed RNA polymerase specialized sigma24 family protein
LFSGLWSRLSVAFDEYNGRGRHFLRAGRIFNSKSLIFSHWRSTRARLTGSEMIVFRCCLAKLTACNAAICPRSAAMPKAAMEQPQEFPTTPWALISEALADGTSVRAAALEELVLRYRPPLRAHLILRKRLDEESADELLQGFITEKILGQYLLRRADRENGKFRSLLVRSLGNYYTDWLRAQHVQPATGADAILAEVPAESEDVSEAFDVAWARQVLDEVLTAMRTSCESDGRAELWGVFESRLLAPLFEQFEPATYEEVCRRFGFTSPEQASNALVTAKRRFQRIFNRVVAQYQHDGEEAEDIVRELIRILSQAGPLQWRNVTAIGSADRRKTSETEHELDDSQPERMARLLELPPDADNLWLHSDLVGVMRHQLAQRLASLDLDVTVSFFMADGAEGSLPLQTLGDLYSHPHPPIELLQAVKRYGRKQARQPDAKLPSEIASIVYFGSIAAALVRRGEWISKSDESLLRSGFERAIAQSWIEAPLRELFQKALTALGPRGGVA